ncbi:MAG: M1 family peptidase, partial [Maribacter sp.]
QVQKHHPFQFPLEIGIINGNAIKMETLQMDKGSQKFEIDLNLKPDNILLDPEQWLLFETK